MEKYIISPIIHCRADFLDYLLFAQFDQIPQIPVQILKHCDHPVGLVIRLPDKFDTNRKHLNIVTPEIIRAEEQENPATGLVADRGFLLRGRCARQQQICAA